MCGIVGYIGTQEALPILISGLKRLEYRGYDSAGVALCTLQGDLRIYKEQGKVADLESKLEGKPLEGHLGIAHTRWATHGEPTSQNAHPHYSQTKHLALVHNGIIENYREIKERLIKRGYTFVSETDTEVLVQLIDYMQKEQECSLLEAVQEALKRVIGAYAIAVIDRRDPQRLVVARNSSPLVIGVGQDYQEFYVGSDPSPIVEYTQEVIFLEDEEVAELMLGQAPKIEDLNRAPIEHNCCTIPYDIGAIEKEGFPHFMLKEIFDQPRCLRDCMRGRINEQQQRIVLSSIIDHGDRLRSAERFVVLACGTSWHAGLIGKQLIESLVRVPVVVEYASEFRYRNPIILPGDVVIAVSQSGETADTLAALKLAKEQGAFIYGICNVVGSSIPRQSDTGTYTHVGPEIGVASTKAFTGQVAVFSMLALALAELKGTISPDRYRTLVKELMQVPDRIEEILQESEGIEELSKVFTYAHNFIYLGRGYNFPIALEGALKLKEISYIHAEGYPAAEMKHGPIALIDEEMPTVVIATQGDTYDKVVSNIQELKARKGRILGIVSRGDTQLKSLCDFTIEIPAISPELEPLLSVVPLQLLSYYIAVTKGKEVDQPRNLAKSVTVE